MQLTNKPVIKTNLPLIYMHQQGNGFTSTVLTIIESIRQQNWLNNSIMKLKRKGEDIKLKLSGLFLYVCEISNSKQCCVFHFEKICAISIKKEPNVISILMLLNIYDISIKE